jgi:hypothetical protein
MKTQKDRLIELSPNQQTPGDAKPTDFEPQTEEIEFGGACGDTPREYRELLKEGAKARKDPRT